MNIKISMCVSRNDIYKGIVGLGFKFFLMSLESNY